jgi:hypothetical protein
MLVMYGQVAELKAGVGQPADAAFPSMTPRGNSRNGSMFANGTISVTVVGEFVRWNEESVARCSLLTPQVIDCLLLLYSMGFTSF